MASEVEQGTQKTSFVLGKKNLYTILIGFATVVVGFILMVGGEGTNPDEFIKEEVFSERRITVAPITVVLGFFIVGVGIMLKPNQTLGESAGDSTNQSVD